MNSQEPFAMTFFRIIETVYLFFRTFTSARGEIKTGGAHHSQTGVLNPLECQSGGCQSYQRRLQ